MDAVVARQFHVQYGLLVDGIVGPADWCRPRLGISQP